MASERNKLYIAVIFTEFVCAGMSLLSKAAITKGMNPHVFVAYRQAFATLALSPFAFFLESKQSAPLSFLLLCKIFFVSLCGITVTLNLFYFALKYVSATFAAAFTTTIPAITFILAVILRIENISIKQRNGIAKVLGSAVGLSGALVFTFVEGPPVYPAGQKEISGKPEKSNSKEYWMRGSLIVLLACLTWSLWLIMQAPIMKLYPEKLRLTTLQCFFSCIQSALLAIVMERNMSSWELGWNGVIVTGIIYWLQVWTVEKKGPVFTAMFTPLSLIITAIFSAFLFKETLHWGSVCGAVLLVVGLYGVLWGKNREIKLKQMNKRQKSKRKQS